MKRQILISSLVLLLTTSLAIADTIHVPGAFPYIDIQQAINIAQTGDVIIIAPGTYIGTGYTINKGITITGTDPNNPYVVAATVIDFDGQDELAFRLTGGTQNKLSGITIANSQRGWSPVSDGVNPGDDGFDNHDWYGGSGINIQGNHIVSNCIIRNGYFEGGPGGNGADGDVNDYPDPEDPTVLPVNYGGNGGRGGHRYGVGIYIDSGSPQILNTVVEDCVAIGGPGGAGGAGLDADDDDPNIPGGPGGDGGNGGNAMGAGVYCNTGTSPTFENCIFRNNQVRAGDAADGNDGGDGIIEDVNLVFPGGDGGHGGVPGLVRGAGVYCDTGVNATFTNCRFIGNRAYGANGGDGGDGGEVHLAMPVNWGGHGGLVEESYSHPGTPQGGNPPSDYSAKGGGVYIEHGSTATFTGCTFSDNVTRCSVSGLGGWPSNGNREHPRKNFNIPTYGAGVYCADLTTTTFTTCTAQGNETTYDEDNGGDPNVIDPEDPNYYIKYTGYEYIGYGGGMCFDGGILGMGNFGYVELNHCNITNNNAPIGGGVFASALTDFHIDECDFVGNWAYLGAGLFSIDNYSTISSSTFTGNRADDPNEDLYGSGGGLFSFSSDVLISDCIFSENTTNGFGAGVYMSGEVAIPPLTADPMLKNCLISNNEAGLDGGGLYFDWYAEPNIINCTITGNEAKGDPPFGVGYGGGLYCSFGSDVNIINSIVWDNAGPNTIGPELAVETWPFFPPTTLTVSNCDVEGGEEEVWVDDYSTLNWGAGNIHTDPLFVTGPLGDYYLSQIAAGQPVDSDCVDAGSDLAINVGLHLYTTRTDEVFDTNMVDMGYHYPLAHPIESCGLSDLSGDGIVNFTDQAILMLYWLRDDCSANNDWCDGADLTFDGYVNSDDLDAFYECWLAEDTSPPLPNPSRWEIEPYSTSMTPPYGVNMTAEAAFDNWGGDVEYYFECVTGNGSDRGWEDPNRTNRTYTDSNNLDPDTEYGYRVKARDERGNEQILWSVVGYAITGEDTTPLSPDPMTWETAPYASGLDSIRMIATTATGPGGVEYYFECTFGNGNNSNWQTSTTYEDTDLVTDTTYGYRVKAHDGNGNETAWSEPNYATPQEDTDPPTPDPMTWATEPYSNAASSIFMQATTADDPIGVEYYFECTSDSQYSSNPNPDVFQDSTTYQLAGLPDGSYTFVVRARDKSPNGNTTGDSEAVTVSFDMTPPDPDPSQWAVGGEPSYYGPDVNGYYWHTMTAEPASDAENEPVEYYFECVNGTTGTQSSGWQLSNVYNYLVSVNPVSFGAYKVRTKDAVGNMTDWSEIGSTLE